MQVLAAEPSGADDAYRSFKLGKLIPSTHPKTIADGLLTSLGEINFAIISQHVKDILTVDDDMIRKAMRLLWERMKIVVEPSGAVPFAAVLSNQERFANKNVGLIVSGGNIDLNAFQWQE